MDVMSPAPAPLTADLWPHPLTAAQRYTQTALIAPDTPLVALLAELLPGVPPDALAVLHNGRLLSAAALAHTTVQPGDMLTVRATLHGGDTNPLNIILTIATLALALYVPGALGLSGVAGALVSAGVSVVGGLLVNALFPVQPPDTPEGGGSAGRQYSISGGANRARPYAPVLLTLGEHRVFPDLAGAEYVEFIGGQQYLNQLFDFGIGDLDISDLRIGDTPLGAYQAPSQLPTQPTFTPTAPYRYPTETWQGYTGAGALADIEQQLARPGEAMTLIAADVDTIAGVPLTDTRPVARTGSPRAVKLGFDFVARLVQYSKKKSRPGPHSVTVRIEYRRVGAATWETHNETLTGTSPEPLRRTVSIDLPGPAGQFEVRVRRTTAPASDTRTLDEVAFTALRTYQMAEADATGRTRLGLRIRATGQLNSRIDRLSALVKNRIPTWDGTAWGSVAEPSSNPADILRWFARGIYADGRLLAGLGLADARIDHAALGAWRDWCDHHQLACNLVVDRAIAVTELMTAIARCGRASLSWHSGRLGVVWDAENKPHSTLITPANVLAGTFSVDYPDGRLADEIVVRYVDPAYDWQYAELRRLAGGVTAPTRTATVTLVGVTDREQAKEETNLIAARQEYHRRRLTWEMGPEGQTLPRGEVVVITHDLISGGVTGRCTGGSAARPKLSTEITITAAADYLECRLADGTLHLSEVQHPDGATATGTTDTPVLITPLPGSPANGGLAGEPAEPGVQAVDVLWRHYAGEHTHRVKIIEVVPLSAERFRLVGIDEVPAYYAAAALALTDPLPVLRYRLPGVLGINVSETLIETGGGYTVEIVVTLTVTGDWRGGVIWAQLDDHDRRVVATLAGHELRAAWIEQPSGTLTITAVPGSDVAPTGAALTVTHHIGGVVAPPATPTTVTVTAVPGGYELSWDDPDEPDYATTQVYDADATVTDIADATLRGEVAATVFLALGRTEAADLAVWVRHRDRAGHTGEAVRKTVTTLPAGAEGVGEEHIFTASATGAKITGAANLPLASWHYDQRALDNGVTRGTQTYYDGTPPDLDEDTPYLIRFRRPITGSPARDADIGTVAWTQDPAVRAYGAPGVGEERIFTATALGGVITGTANLPLATWHYQMTGLDDGLTRGTQTYYAGTPPDLDKDKPFLITFRRPVSGFPAANTDIGEVPWTQDPAIHQFAEDGAGVKTVTATATGVTIETTDGTTTDVAIRQITDVSRNVDTGVVTVTYSDGATDTFTVPDGKDGTDGRDAGAANLGALTIQRIYRRSATSIKPTLATSSAAQRQSDTYVPTGATRSYSAPSSALPFAWIAYRYGVAGSWTHWTDWQSNGFHATALGRRSAVTYQPVATTATAWSDQLANNTTDGANVITDMVTQYNDTAKWTETRYWTGTAWQVVNIRLSENYFFEGSIGARFLAVENLAALGIKVKDIDVEGVISAEHISADVFNVALLWGGTYTVPSGSNTSSPINLQNSQDIDDWDTLLILARDIAGSDRGFVSTMVPAGTITSNALNTATEMRVGGYDFTLGRNAAGTQLYPAGAGGSSRISIHKIWGLKDPGNSGATTTVPSTPASRAPGAPRSVSADVDDYSSGTEDNDIRLTWSAPSDWGTGAANTRAYRLRLFRGGVQVGSTITRTASTTSYTWTALSNATYSVEIQARTEDGDSAWVEETRLVVNVTQATATFSLSPSSDQNIQEGASRLFTIRLSRSLASSVSFSIDLTGNGAGSDVSFSSSASSTSITRTISAGSASATFRVYARDDDSTDDATLEVSTSSSLITGTTSRSLDIEPTAASTPSLTRVTSGSITTGRITDTTRGYRSGATSNAIGSKTGLNAGSIDVLNLWNWIDRGTGIIILNLPSSASNSDSTFQEMRIGSTTFTRSSASFRTVTATRGTLSGSTYNQWAWNSSVLNNSPVGTTFSVSFWR